MICLKYLCAQQEHIPWYTKYYISLYYRHPTSSSKKGEIIQWLDQKGIAYPPGALKAELLQIVRAHKPPKQYVLDQFMEANGHSVLRLPPYHSDLNPIGKITCFQ